MSVDALLLIADRLEASVRRRFLSAIAQLRGRIDLDGIVVDIAAGNVDRALLRLDVTALTEDLRDAATVLIDGFQRAGVATADAVNVQFRTTIAFDVTNPYAVAAARQLAARLVTQVGVETQAAIRDAVTRAFEEGLTRREVSQLIKPLIGLTARDAQAVLNFRAALEAEGLRADLTLKKTAAYAERKLRERARTIARTECLPGPTVVDGAVVRAVSRRWYEGVLVEIGTNRGRQFAATPNHPMLLRSGWQPAGKVTAGDDLVCDGRHQHAGAPRHEDVHGMPPTISEIFDAVAAVGIHERRDGRQPDFHGDGLEGQVDILRPSGELALGRFAPLFEPAIELLFAPPDEVVRSRLPLCPACGRLLSIDEQPCECGGPQLNTGFGQHAFDGFGADPERCANHRGPLASAIAMHDVMDGEVVPTIRRSATALIEETTSITERSRHTGLAQQVLNPREISADYLCDASAAQAAAIEFDRVTTIRVRPFRGHVYNLWTPHGYFTANAGVYTGNTMMASNAGQHALWQQAIDRGLLPADVKRRWSTAHDERVCQICGPMNGRTVGMNEDFTLPSGARVRTPPAHPNCRCVAVLARAAQGRAA
jgi:hypothetical protein